MLSVLVPSVAAYDDSSVEAPDRFGGEQERSIDTAVSGTDPATAAGAPVSVGAEWDRGVGELRYELVLGTRAGPESASFVVGNGTDVVVAEGTETEWHNGQRVLRWDGERDSIRIVLRTTAGDGEATDTDVDVVAADGWTLGEVPFATFRWSHNGSTERVRPLGDDLGALDGDGRRTFGDRFVLVGAQRTVTDAAHGQRVRLVAPAGTTIAAGEREVLSALTAAAGQLRVGAKDDDVLVLALPAPARRGGQSFPVHDEMWVRADEPLDDPNSVWLHEYVHTRQSFVLADEMAWFREASAEYYAAWLAYEQDRISRAEFRDHLDGEPRRVALTDPEAWSGPGVPYTKGARVLAMLDGKIRAATDGERSLQDVFRRLNEHDDPVTYAAFTDAVAAVAGRRIDAWLNRYVAGPDPVAPYYNTEPPESGLLDSLRDAAAQGHPGALLLAAVVLFSGVGSLPLYRLLARRERRRRRPRGGSVRR